MQSHYAAIGQLPALHRPIGLMERICGLMQSHYAAIGRVPAPHRPGGQHGQQIH